MGLEVISSAPDASTPEQVDLDASQLDQGVLTAFVQSIVEEKLGKPPVLDGSNLPIPTTVPPQADDSRVIAVLPASLPEGIGDRSLRLCFTYREQRIEFVVEFPQAVIGLENMGEMERCLRLAVAAVVPYDVSLVDVCFGPLEVVSRDSLETRNGPRNEEDSVVGECESEAGTSQGQYDQCWFCFETSPDHPGRLCPENPYLVTADFEAAPTSMATREFLRLSSPRARWGNSIIHHSTREGFAVPRDPSETHLYRLEVWQQLRTRDNQIRQRVEVYDLARTLTSNFGTGSWFPEGDWSQRKLALTAASVALADLCAMVQKARDTRLQSQDREMTVQEVLRVVGNVDLNHLMLKAFEVQVEVKLSFSRPIVGFLFYPMRKQTP